ncbi:MAG: ABC transporter ATP-binding protein [Synergistaceae bacterium]|nr:ABC transporter ATP-binding protein [Synergistaceae bacterium]
MKRILEINDVKKIYSGKVSVEALKGVSLSVEKSEFLSIVGVSGSGKSTLMNILGCLDKPSEGTYILNGKKVSDFTADELSEIRNKAIGFVFQTFNLLPNLTAVQNVEVPMIYCNTPKKIRRQKALEALDKVMLSKRANHMPHELSGGEAQRVAIARAFVNNPLILLADEPTGNLDTRATKEILSIFQRLNREGMTIVMITHELSHIRYTKRVVCLMDGSLHKDITIRFQKMIQ